jgi:hypothetical protein
VRGVRKHHKKSFCDPGPFLASDSPSHHGSYRSKIEKAVRPWALEREGGRESAQRGRGREGGRGGGGGGRKNTKEMRGGGGGGARDRTK